jgi:hypothetical protein
MLLPLCPFPTTTSPHDAFIYLCSNFSPFVINFHKRYACYWYKGWHWGRWLTLKSCIFYGHHLYSSLDTMVRSCDLDTNWWGTSPYVIAYVIHLIISSSCIWGMHSSFDYPHGSNPQGQQQPINTRKQTINHNHHHHSGTWARPHRDVKPLLNPYAAAWHWSPLWSIGVAPTTKIIWTRATKFSSLIITNTTMQGCEPTTAQGCEVIAWCWSPLRSSTDDQNHLQLSHQNPHAR